MNHVIGEMLPLAAGIAISPIPIMAIVLMLLTPNAGKTSVGFTLGWVFGIIAATAVCMVAAAAIPKSDGGPDTTKGIILLVLAILMLWMGIRQWQTRPKPGEPGKLPGWMAAMDKITAVKAAGLGFLLSAIQPKNLMMAASAGAIIGTGLHGQVGSQIGALAIFTLIAGCSVYLPPLVYVSAKDKVAAPLSRLKDWLQQNNHEVMAIVLVLIGVALLGKGISAF